MVEFVNTIDVLGDDALVDSLIEKTLTEFKDNTLTAIGENAFYDIKQLTTIDVPSAITIRDQAFRGCNRLAEVNIPSVTTIGYGAFYSDERLVKLDAPMLTAINGRIVFRYTNLDTLILRASSVCTLANADSIANTPIARGIGYIYVPRALLNEYRNATNFSTYASQFRALEDYTVDGTTTGELDETKI